MPKMSIFFEFHAAERQLYNLNLSDLRLCGMCQRGWQLHLRWRRFVWSAFSRWLCRPKSRKKLIDLVLKMLETKWLPHQL